MPYSIRQTIGDSTVEIAGDTPTDTFHLFLMVQENAKEQSPAVTDAVLRQLMDSLDALSEQVKQLAGGEMGE